MKIRSLFFLGGALWVTVSGLAQVIAPAQRQATLTAAQELLAPKEPAVKAEVNPFLSTAFAEAAYGMQRTVNEAGPAPAIQPTGPRSAQDTLAAIASALKPSGSIVLGGEPTLVFGQKRVKAGGTLTITFENQEYILEVTAINRTSFTVRLNGADYTRPIR